MQCRLHAFRAALLLALASAAACGEDAERLARAAGAPGVASAIDAATRALAADSVEPPRRPDRIYHDLTDYDWYNRGEPLVAGGSGFQPDGAPRSIPLDSLERAGTYQGVDFYVRRRAAQPYDTLFVPVFEDYWQPFLPVGPATAPAPAPAPAG